MTADEDQSSITVSGEEALVDVLGATFGAGDSGLVGSHVRTEAAISEMARAIREAWLLMSNPPASHKLARKVVRP